MKKENKIRMIRQAIVTIATLLGVSAVSYAAVKNSTMIYKNTTGVSLEGTNGVINTIEHEGVANNEVYYKVETPDNINVTHNGIIDKYESVYNDGTLPVDLYMEISILDGNLKNNIQEKNADLVEEYKKNCAQAENLKISNKEYDAIHYYYSDGLDWDSTCHDVYIIDVNEEKIMVVDIQYFIEATEGWGSVCNQLLQTLEIYE